MIRKQRNINDNFETKDDLDTLAKNKEWYRKHYGSTPKPGAPGGKSTTLYVLLSFLVGLIATAIACFCKTKRFKCIKEFCIRPEDRAPRNRHPEDRTPRNRQHNANCDVSDRLICKFFKVASYL